MLVDGLRKAADTVSRLQRSLEECLARAERARESSADKGPVSSGTLHLVGQGSESDDPQQSGTLVTAMSIRGFEVDTSRHTVDVDGRPVLLTPNEWQLFALMLAQPGRTLSRDELAIGSWGHGFGGRDSEVEVYVSRLRRKLESGSCSPLVIETVRGVGYRLVPPGKPPSGGLGEHKVTRRKG